MRAAEPFTYYDVLCVEPNASEEQIREAFRTLALLLHPDRQTEPELRAAAEAHMRKVNVVYGILSDPDERRRYDASLAAKKVPFVFKPAPDPRRPSPVQRVGWMLAALALSAALVWLASEGAIGSPEAGIPDRQALSREEDLPARRRPILLPLAVERPRAAVEALALPPTSRAPALGPMPQAAPDPPAEAAPALPAPSLPLARPAASRTVPAPPAVSRPKGFAGFWFFARTADARKGGPQLYPPEFIEATITERNGTVSGKFRSRYKIADRAISPDVAFEFTGSPNGSTLVCPWRGTGGATGSITLRIGPDDAMRIDWTAQELGDTQGLASGTATLTRRID